MKFDEVKTAIMDILKNPDERMAELPGVLDKIEADYKNMDTMMDRITTADDKIRSLQDTNMKLFLAQTAPAGEESGSDDGEDLTGVDAINHFWGELDKEA